MDLLANLILTCEKNFNSLSFTPCLGEYSASGVFKLKGTSQEVRYFTAKDPTEAMKKLLFALDAHKNTKEFKDHKPNKKK